MSFEVLPNEILKLIISFLCKKDAKNVALTSKRMHDLALERIWYKVSPKWSLREKIIEQKDVDFYKKLSHLPIREISICYFWRWQCEEVAKTFPYLSLLHLDHVSANLKRVRSKYFQQFKMPIALYTEIFKICRQSHFDELLKVIKSCNVLKLIINHHPYESRNQIRWSPNFLKMFVNEVPEIEISVKCLAFNEKDNEELFKVMATNKNCMVYFPQDANKTCLRLFSVKDIELMAKYDIRLTELSSEYMMMPGNDERSQKRFAEALAKLKHLKSFKFYSEYSSPMTIENFIHVPITKLGTSYFISGKNELEKTVQTLSKMKSLRHLCIGSSGYKFLSEDLAMFKGLPVKSIFLDTLDLNKENIPEFRRVMMEMNIERIHKFPYSSAGKSKNEELGIEIKSHGLGGIYKTI